MTNKLGKLSLAILESLVSSKLGDKFVDELRSNYDRKTIITTALEYTEHRFIREFLDKDISKAMFIDLAQKDRPTLQEAIIRFYDHPSEPGFPDVLRKILTSDFPKLPKNSLQDASMLYVSILKEELALVDENFRKKILALTDLRRDGDYKEGNEILRRIELAVIRLNNQTLGNNETNEIDRVNRKRIRTLLAPSYDQLIGRNQEVENLYETVKKKRLSVIYGPSGVGLSSIAREVAGKFDRQKEPTPETDNREIFVIWYPIPPHSHEQQQAYEDLKYKISNALGIDSLETTDQLDALNDGFNVLVVDGLRQEIAQSIVEHLSQLLVTNVRVLITTHEELPWETYPCNPTKIKVEGLAPEYIGELFRLYGQNRTITDEDALQIANYTDGNIQRLKVFASTLDRYSLEDIISQNPKGQRNEVQFDEMEQKGIQPSESDDEILPEVEQLSISARQYLKILALYDDYAHETVLASIVDPQYRNQSSSALHELQKSYLVRKKSDSHWYQIEDLYRQYLVVKMKANHEYDKVRDDWAHYYLNLRPENDEIGWTIFTDYQPEYNQGVNYADEASAILSVIRYYLGERIDTHWDNAAKLLDDFRATIFASGRWDDRLIYCRKVIQQAKAKGNLALLGKFYRLLAWTHCFRDEYVEGSEAAQAAIDVANQGLTRIGITDKDLNIHRQTLYKAYNTFGQIALRGARRLARAGLQLQNPNIHLGEGIDNQSNLKLIANSELESAVLLFREAEIKFAQALLLVERFYPPEALIMEYHMAEVKYYDRHAISTIHPEAEALYTYEQLFRVHGLFLNVLNKAQEPFQGFVATRPHRRLIANTKLYLGKTLRRIGALTSQHTISESDKYFNEAERYLSEASTLANEYSDRVLMAKIKFAQCQWHESQHKRTTNKVTKDNHLNTAKQYALEAIQAFQKTRMRLEGDDAEAFYEDRLSRADV